MCPLSSYTFIIHISSSSTYTSSSWHISLRFLLLFKLPSFLHIHPSQGSLIFCPKTIFQNSSNIAHKSMYLESSHYILFCILNFSTKYITLACHHLRKLSTFLNNLIVHLYLFSINYKGWCLYILSLKLLNYYDHYAFLSNLPVFFPSQNRHFLLHFLM